jgi:hypothetical protein
MDSLDFSPPVAPDLTSVPTLMESPVAPPVTPLVRRTWAGLGRGIAAVLLAAGLIAIGGVAAVSAASPDPSPAASGAAPSVGSGAGPSAGLGGPAAGGSTANCPNM